MRKPNLAIWFYAAIGLLLVGSLVACAEKSQKLTAVSQYKEALQAAKDYQGPVSPAARKLYEEGVEYYRAGHWAEAANLLSQARQVDVAHFPMRPEAMIYEAISLRKINQNREAAMIARQIIQEYPDRWEGHLILAQYWIWREEYDNAEKELVSASRLAPQQPDVMQSLAIVRLGQGMMMPALEAARGAYRLKPNDEDNRKLLTSVYLAYARNLERENDLSGAVTELFKAGSLVPQDPRPPLVLSRLLLRLNLPQAARRYALEGRKLLADPKQVPVEVFALEATGEGEGDEFEYRRMADFYLVRNMPDVAAVQLEQALAVNPRQADVWLTLGMLRAKDLQEPVEALDCLHAMWILDPDNPGIAGLTAALSVTDEAVVEPSPGFVARAQVGTGYNPNTHNATGNGGDQTVGTRMYCSFVLDKAAGRHQIRWQVAGPDGETVADESWSMEFFGREFGFSETVVWYQPGEYRVIWSMDDAVRSQATFRLTAPNN